VSLDVGAIHMPRAGAGAASIRHDPRAVARGFYNGA
jgi:hypothetical protein